MINGVLAIPESTRDIVAVLVGDAAQMIQRAAAVWFGRDASLPGLLAYDNWSADSSSAGAFDQDPCRGAGCDRMLVKDIYTVTLTPEA